MSNSQNSILAFLATAALALIATACGPSDPCSTTTCEYGTCSSQSGECVNEDSCNVD